MDLHAVYLGDRLGYYRALAAGPLTSAELAERTGTAERYAREWLEQQAVTGILDTDPEVDATHRRYTLPAQHVAPLDRRRSTWGTSRPSPAPTIGFVKQVDHLVEAFRTGGGVSWAQLGRRRPRGPGRRQPAAVPRPAGPGVPAVDPGRRRRAAGRWTGGRRGLRVRLVVDRHRARLPRRHGGRLRRRRPVDRGGAAQRPRGGCRRPGAVPRRGRRATVDTDESYDAVFAFECIHDLPDPVGVLAAMRRLAGDAAPSWSWTSGWPRRSPPPATTWSG